jgi:hypothetical protein
MMSKILIFVSVLAVLGCLFVLVATIVASRGKGGDRKDSGSRNDDERRNGRY